MSANGPAELTEANLEARDFRLELARETLRSFKRDRSRSPLRIEPLTDAARRALDVVYNRDKEARIESQRLLIAKQAQRIRALETEVNGYKGGRMCMMSDVWREFFKFCPKFRALPRNEIDTIFNTNESLFEYLYDKSEFSESEAEEEEEEEDDLANED